RPRSRPPPPGAQGARRACRSTFLRRDLRHARRVGARRRERLPELGERQPGAAPGPARGAGRRARPPGLPGGDGGRGPRGGRRAPRARRADRARPRHPPRRLGVVLLPRSGRQPDPGPLPARDRGVSEARPLRLVDIVDYFTYVIVPMLFVLRFDLLPPALAVPVALCPVLASAYGFCRTDAKTADHYFTGFPSYWNIVAFYLYTLGWPRALNAA